VNGVYFDEVDVEDSENFGGCQVQIFKLKKVDEITWSIEYV
jgi:hypothetical protein